LFVDIASVLSIAKPKFKKELFLIPDTCMAILRAALAQGRVLHQTAARSIEATTCLRPEEEFVAVIYGEWKTTQLFDGEDWKNNSSMDQREGLDPYQPLRRVTTLVPRERTIAPDSFRGIPVKKLEHVCLAGFTFLLYHVQDSRFSLDRSSKRLKTT
jgi:hypothetical protein